MDEDQIQKVVDAFTDRLKRELESVVRQVRESAEIALQEINALGLNEHNASGLLMQLADLEGIIDRTRETATELSNKIFEELDMMDAEEGLETRRRIVERLKIFYTEFEKMMGG